MCQRKSSPIKAKYHNSFFGDHADHCLVGVISHINNDEEFTTVASCCGHGKKRSVPYITVIQPRSRIREVKSFLEGTLGWKDLGIIIFRDLPDDAWDQLGDDFMVGKVYVGYYAGAKYLDVVELDNSETWRGDDIQMDESEELSLYR